MVKRVLATVVIIAILVVVFYIVLGLLIPKKAGEKPEGVEQKAPSTFKGPPPGPPKPNFKGPPGPPPGPSE